MELERFNELVYEELASDFFHISNSDLDENNIHLTDSILLNFLNRHPEVLKVKSLTWFVDTFIKQ